MPNSFSSRSLRLFEPDRAMRVVIGLVAVYAVAFAFLYPAAITVADESAYINQARLILESGTLPVVDSVAGRMIGVQPIGLYPLGTALLLLPFVALGGWHAAFWLPLLCTAAAVWVTARWLRDLSLSPLWAALLLGYPATLVMGRVAMSEAPSLLVAALGLWLFFRGIGRGGVVWVAAGFAAGLSASFRETNVLLLAPLFVGSVVRRDRGGSALLVGGLLGLAVRAVSAWFFFGDPWFIKPSSAPFTLSAVLQSAPIYLFSLLVLFPGGLVAGLAYRGPRRLEVVATVVLFTACYVSYGYSATQSGLPQRLILGPRYFIPLLPLLALCAAEVWPRWARRVADAAAVERRRSLERAAGAAVAIGVVAIGVAAVGVQWVHADWGRERASARDAIYSRTTEGSILVTNWNATGKLLDLIYGKRAIVKRQSLGPLHLDRLGQMASEVYVVFLDRNDSAFWRQNAAGNAAFIRSFPEPPKLDLDLEVSPTERLRIWRVTPGSR